MSFDSNAEREAFQIAIEKAFWPQFSANGSFAVYPDGMYISDETRKFWKLWQLARSQPSEWVAKVQVEALRVAIDMFEDMATATVKANDALKQPTADVLTAINKEIFASMAKDLRALLPPNTEAKS